MLPHILPQGDPGLWGHCVQSGTSPQRRERGSSEDWGLPARPRSQSKPTHPDDSCERLPGPISQDLRQPGSLLNGSQTARPAAWGPADRELQRESQRPGHPQQGPEEEGGGGADAPHSSLLGRQPHPPWTWGHMQAQPPHGLFPGALGQGRSPPLGDRRLHLDMAANPLPQPCAVRSLELAQVGTSTLPRPLNQAFAAQDTRAGLSPGYSEGSCRKQLQATVHGSPPNQTPRHPTPGSGCLAKPPKLSLSAQPFLLPPTPSSLALDSKGALAHLLRALDTGSLGQWGHEASTTALQPRQRPSH